jgi:ABC-2 type transport system ATP-binding protein
MGLAIPNDPGSPSYSLRRGLGKQAYNHFARTEPARTFSFIFTATTKVCFMNGSARVLVEADHLVKRYGDKVAVDDVSFTVQSGEIFGFLGPNGAGKTTTIKMIVGLLKPSMGTARVGGYDVQAQPLLAKAASGYVPDEPNLYSKLSARELLRFVGDLYGLPADLVTRRSEELLRLFDLSDAADDLADSYSHGMQQKTSLATALIHDPVVLILDEPTVGLDPKSARLIKDILRQIANRGAAVMLSTHILEIAERMCDRIGIINKGRLVAVGTLEELRAMGGTGETGASLEDIFLELTGGAEFAEIAEVLK